MLTELFATCASLFVYERNLLLFLHKFQTFGKILKITGDRKPMIFTRVKALITLWALRAVNICDNRKISDDKSV